MAIAQEMILAQKFLSESLIQYEPNLIDTVYPEYWAYEGKYHNATAGLAFGAEGMTTARRDFTGKAVNYGGKATTIPLANFGITMDKYKNLKGILAADWTWSELRAEEVASQNPYQPTVNVVASYREALERGLREWQHYHTIFGDEQAGFTGMLNNPYVEVFDVAAAANPFTGTGSPTANDRYQWFLNASSSFKKSSKLTSGQIMAMTSVDVRSSLNTRFTDNGGDGNPFALLTTASSPIVSDVVEVNEFDGAEVRNPDVGNMTVINGVTLPGTAGGVSTFDLMLLCENGGQGASSIQRRYADIETMPPFMLDDGMTYRQIGITATSEVIYTQPFRARLYILRKV
jgi:Uncharacterized protein conserved in bacteria (DUF2184)